MPLLTADQLNMIAVKLLIIEQSIDIYLDSDAGAGLSEAQKNDFIGQRDQIGDAVDRVADMAIDVAIDDANTAVASLNVVTSKIKSDITHITNVQKVINLAGAAATVAAAILTTPVSGAAIIGRIPGLVTTAKAIFNPPANS